jgi:hypothetical protein
VKTFSQRKGIVPVSEVIQSNGMTETLRNSLWNALDIEVWSQPGFLYRQPGTPDIDALSKALWFDFFKRPIDTRPRNSSDTLKVIREFFFSCEWNQAYDLIEWIAQGTARTRPKLIPALNFVLERELSAYRIASGVVTDITSTQEIQMLEAAIKDSRFAGPAGHLQRALELLSDRENPDYRNSIKESISAVEGMARIVAEAPKATLGDALKALEKAGKLHPALKDGFLKLYGYTSDEGGIRHAMLEEPNISAADAKYFLLSCTSFVNYLKAQL